VCSGRVLDEVLEQQYVAGKPLDRLDEERGEITSWEQERAASAISVA